MRAKHLKHELFFTDDEFTEGGPKFPQGAPAVAGAEPNAHKVYETMFNFLHAEKYTSARFITTHQNTLIGNLMPIK